MMGPVAARLHRLHPDPAAIVDVADAYATPLGSHPGRPWVSLCMIASIDGSTVVDGRSGGLGGAVDTAVLGQLRRVADVIVVGASTARLERYGPPSKPGQRIGVVTASGNVDFDSELFTSGSGFVITTDDADFAVPRDVDVVRAGPGRVDFDRAIRSLDEVVAGCATVQAEGGPTLNSALLGADVVDELNQTISPHTVGGDGARLAAGDEPWSRGFDLAQVAVDDDSYLYLRWQRRR